MNCLVLGGAGFIGSHIVDALVARGHSVRVFDRAEVDNRNLRGSLSRVQFIGGDLGNEIDLARSLEGVDVVVHLVSTTTPQRSNEDPVYDVETNLVGTLKLLNLARQLGVKKVVFSSSGGTVYGEPGIQPIPETHPTEPICSYGIVKLAIEKYLNMFCHLYGLDYVVLRSANPYGERQNPFGDVGAVSVFLGKILRRDPIVIWGDGSVQRDYFYIGDLVSAYIKVIEASTRSRMYNVGSGKAHSLNEIIATIARVTGRTPVIHRTRARRVDVQVSCLDISRAVTELGWAPCVSLEEGIGRTWAWLKGQYAFE